MADHCRSCDAPIEWAITVKGSRIPLDIGSHPNANINVGPDGIARVVEPGQGVRISHFATCPNSRQHRKPSPAAEAQRRRLEAEARGRHPTSRGRTDV